MTHSTINVVIGHETYPVHVLEGQEALSVPFYFKVDFLASLEVETLPQMLLTRAKLHFLQDNVMVREVIGVISEIRVLGYYNDDQIYFQLKLQSKLALLEHSGGINHFPAIDLKNCAFQVVKKHGINEKNLVWISQNDREKTNYFQMDTENDLEFVTRVLTEKSIYFYSVFKDEEELMCFCHDHFHEGYRSLNISKAPTLDNNAELNHIKVFHRLVHNRVLVRSHKPLVANEIQQEEKERRKKKPFKKEYFGYEKIKSYAAIEENKEFYIKVFGNLMDLKLNDRVMLAADVCNNKYDGTYHVVSLKHVAKQPTGIQGQGKPAYYHVEVKLLPDHCLFQKTKSLNGMLSLYAAKIVGEDKEKADLNENGHYKIRYLFDRENKIVFNVPRLTTFAVNPVDEKENAGFHTPLLDGTEVIVGFLYNDPNQAVILGSLPNEMMKSPVIDKNCFDNYFITYRQHQLLMHESPERSLIKLATKGDMQQVTLVSGNENSKIVIENKENGVLLNGKEQVIYFSGDDVIESSNQRSLYVAEDTYHLKSENDQYFQTKELMEMIAKENIKLSAGQDFNIETSNIHIEANDQVEMICEGKIFGINAQKGCVELSAQDEILIQGTGVDNIFLGNAETSITIEKNGEIIITGEVANLLSENKIEFKGEVQGF